MLGGGVRHTLGAAALAALLAACASSPMVRAASRGDRAALAREVALADVHGRMSLAEAADVARAVVSRELEAAPTVDDAVARVHDVRACAFVVENALEERMKKGDVAAGEAALELAEANLLSRGEARDHEGSGDDRWRAAAMWTRTGGDDHDARRRGLVDGSPAVRRAALRAIAARDDGTDWDAVLEAARLDPEPLVRMTAVRELAHLHAPPANLVSRLGDLWTDADDPLREDLAIVLASPGVAEAGGFALLAHELASSSGNEAVGIASAILRSRVRDDALRAAAVTQLAAALKSGGQRARAHAIAVAPLDRSPGDTALLDAMKDAARSDDPGTRMAALGRLADPRSRAVAAVDRDNAREVLETLAAPEQSSELQASRARLLLAAAGDLQVQAWVEADLRSPDPGVRTNAGEALAALHRASRAAPLLADDDPAVRTRAACTILLEARLQ